MRGRTGPARASGRRPLDPNPPVPTHPRGGAWRDSRVLARAWEPWLATQVRMRELPPTGMEPWLQAEGRSLVASTINDGHRMLVSEKCQA